MKTATVTWVTYNNYGTLLQAYALQQQLEKMGINNTILSDCKVLQVFKHEYIKKEEDHITDIVSENGRCRLYNLLMNPKRISRVILARANRKEYERPYMESQEKCDFFKQTELKIYDEVNPNDLEDLNKLFDVFIAGSDQVWAVFEKMFNPYYYLEFAHKKKISYAPSLGTTIISKQRAERIKNLLSDFSAISVREKASAGQLSKFLKRDVEWVADPTLLQDRFFWSEFAAEIPVRKRKYIFCYFLENKAWYFEYAKGVARKLNFEIVLMPNRWEYLSSQYVVKTGVGPKEFVSLIQHADYVLTDSYHGSIFSLIFERSFQYLLRFDTDDPNSQNIRVQSLFDYLDLNQRIVTEERVGDLKEGIDYEKINKKIDCFRQKSIDYLESALYK